MAGTKNGKRATIVDVARLAGVSTSTVSHVVNGTRNVAPATRRRVDSAVATTGFTLDAGARSLRRSRTDSIGLVVPDSGEPAFRDMVTGVEAAARAAGLSLLLADTGEDAAQERRAVDVFRSRRVDGVILARVGEADPSVLEELIDDEVPVVLMDRLTDDRVDQVGVDNERAMRRIVGHLLDLGHRHIAYVGGEPSVPTLGERRDGFLAAFADHGAAVSDARILSGPGSAEATRDRVARLLADRDGLTAIVTASSPMAVGALRAARDGGVEIPRDLAFVSFDSLPYPDLMATAVTTADQPAVTIGRDAMRLLLRRLSDPEAPATTARLTARISHRESCGCGEPGTPLA